MRTLNYFILMNLLVKNNMIGLYRFYNYNNRKLMLHPDTWTWYELRGSTFIELIDDLDVPTEDDEIDEVDELLFNSFSNYFKLHELARLCDVSSLKLVLYKNIINKIREYSDNLVYLRIYGDKYYIAVTDRGVISNDEIVLGQFRHWDMEDNIILG